jgi:uncharacterized membrane protein YfhO
VGGVWIARPDAEPLASVSAPDGSGRIPLEMIRDYGVIKIQLNCHTHGRIIVRETFDPSWRAELDGAAVAVEPHSGAFLGVPVPAGRHDLVLCYDPPEVRTALAATLSALAATVFALTGFCPFRSTRIIALGLGRTQAAELESDL